MAMIHFIRNRAVSVAQLLQKGMLLLHGKQFILFSCAHNLTVDIKTGDCRAHHQSRRVGIQAMYGPFFKLARITGGR